jgi:hypothetical protein
VECKSFDAQVARPKGRLKALQKKFIRLRMTSLSDVDIGLFDFDFDTTMGIFILNSEEQIYLRYGGRDDRAAESFLSEKGLCRALEEALEMHEAWRGGLLKLPPRPPVRLAQSFPEIKKIVNGGKCVHCHHVAHELHKEREKAQGYEQNRDIWTYPDPARLGLELDPKLGPRLKKPKGAAKRAGLKRGDLVTRVGDRDVVTIGDLQYALHKLPVTATELRLTVSRRGAEATVELALPEYWRVTNLNRRTTGHLLGPFPGFWSRMLTAKEKKRLGLDPEGFASRVTKFWLASNGKRAGVQVGDIVYEVDGARSDPYARHVGTHIRMTHAIGGRVTVKVLRGKKRLAMSWKLKWRAG